MGTARNEALSTNAFMMALRSDDRIRDCFTLIVDVNIAVMAIMPSENALQVK